MVNDKEKTILTRRVLIEKFEFMGIGAVVKVVHSGMHYSNYRVKFIEMGFKSIASRLNYSSLIFYDKEFEIFSKSTNHRNGELICGIEDEEGNQFLFGQTGLSYI